eukprot:scaffold99865_cov75-Phaeocystis_antarctica.AAC.5
MAIVSMAVLSMAMVSMAIVSKHSLAIVSRGRLLDEGVAARADLAQHRERRAPPRLGERLGGHREWVDEALRVLLGHAVEQGMHRAAHQRRGAVDARDDLRDDGEPRVDGDGVDALTHRGVDLRALAVLEPEREQPQDVLQRHTLAAQRDGAREAAHRGYHILGAVVLRDHLQVERRVILSRATASRASIASRASRASMASTVSVGMGRAPRS